MWRSTAILKIDDFGTEADMTTIRELEKAVAAIARGNQDITLRSVSLANPRITTDLGPLTSKLHKLKTINTAIALNYLLGPNKRGFWSTKCDYEAMRNSIRSLSETLIFSDKLMTTSYSSSVKEILDRCNHSKISSSMTSVTKKLTPDPSTPLWATALDIGLATGLSFVPFVGPVLAAGASGGLGKLVSGLAGMGTTALNTELGVSTLSSYNSTYKATTSVQDGLNQMPGAGLTAVATPLSQSKTTAGTALVAYLAKRDEKKAKKTLSDPTAFVNSFGRVINPITQNQLLNNEIFKNIQLNIVNPDVISAKTKIENCLEGESDTVESFIDKFGLATELSGKLIVAVVTSCIVDSFSELLNEYDEMFSFYRPLPELSRLSPLYNYDKNNNISKARALSLLITAYYLNPGISASIHSKTGVGSAFISMFTELGIAEMIDNKIRGGVQSGGSGNPKQGVAEKLSMQRDNIKDTFSGATSPSVAFSAAADKGKDYIILVKDSMIDTINKVLFANNNAEHFKEIMTIFCASNMIVNSVWKAAAIQQDPNKFFSESFTLPKKAVEALKNAGFVKFYSTTIGRVSNAQKLEHMGGATIAQGSDKLVYSDTARKTATLRYYDGTFKGASDREKIMLYLFARAVTSDLNLFHVFMGVVSWTAVKEQLHSVVAEINISSHFVDQKDLRPG